MANPVTDPKTLTADQVFDYARKSVTKGRDGTNRSIADQHACNQETADYHGLPLLQENWLTEDKNKSGGLWWKKCPEIGLEWGVAADQPYRRVLTTLITGVVTGKIKCVIVWAVDRLARDIAVAKILADLFAKHGCLLWDRNGQVFLDSPEARNSFFQTILASQQYKEMCAVNSPRGVKKLRERGRVICTGNVYGYRHVAKGRVKAVTEEIETVRRIYAMACTGMSQAAIARQLMSEGIILAPDLYETRSLKRIEDTYDVIYNKQIRAILTDCRFQGRQPHEGQEWDCPAFLIDGKPAVEPALYKRVQEIISARRPASNNVSDDNYLAGLFKCGLCGQYLTLNPLRQKDGTIKRYWVSKKHDIQTWCTHSLPNITEGAMRSYTETVLLPLLLTELEAMREVVAGTDVAAEMATVKNQIAVKQKEFRDCIKRQFAGGKLSALTASILEEEHLEEIATLDKRLGQLQQLVAESETTAAAHAHTASLVEKWATYNDYEKKLAIQSALRWVIMLPSEDFSSRPKRRGGAISIDRKKDGAPPAGRVVYLTSWGTFHSAVVKRVPNPDSKTWHKQLGLVAAPLEECIGSCADLPDPAGLAAGLERSYKGRSFKFHPSEVMPGYLAPQKIAEFEVQ